MSCSNEAAIKITDMKNAHTERELDTILSPQGIMSTEISNVEVSMNICLNINKHHINNNWKITIPIKYEVDTDRLKWIANCWKENPRMLIEAELMTDNPYDLIDVVFESIKEDDTLVYTHPKRVTWKEYGMLQEFLSREMWEGETQCILQSAEVKYKVESFYSLG